MYGSLGSPPGRSCVVLQFEWCPLPQVKQEEACYHVDHQDQLDL